MDSNTVKENPLGVLPTGKLLTKFAVPSIISMLVSALYNIVDQYFIGNRVGELGNAATNIAFPLSTACVAISLLFGIGGASAFNLAMGAGDKKRAARFFTNGAMSAVSLGLLLAVVASIFLRPMLMFFGSPEGEVFEYAVEYTRITAIGFPFVIYTVCGGHLVRADGRPTISMLCNISGAVVNVILDAIFVWVLNWGMTGAALATIIGQIISATLTAFFYFRPQTFKLEKEDFKLEWKAVGRIASLGAAPCTNQISMMIVQIVMNKSLKYYGSMSVYGESVPIACVGIISKVNMLFMSFIIGISQGLQPIASFNYGAKKYDRVKKALLQGYSVAFILAVLAFVGFQFFPRPIISIFGEGSEEYFQFSVNYFKIFLLFTFLNFLQPLTSNFMTATGKPKKGMFLALTRQIIFLLPLIVILPIFFGIDGIMYAGPVSDFVAAVTSVGFLIYEFKKPEYKK